MKNSQDAQENEPLLKELEEEVRRLQLENSNLKKELRNITRFNSNEQKRTEFALRQSQKLLLQIFNHTPLPVIVLRCKDYSAIAVNDTYLDFCGLTKHEIFENRTLGFGEWENPHEMIRFIEAVNQNGVVKNFEMNCRLLSGAVRTLIVSAVLINWQEEECILAIGDDITDLKKYQIEMRRLEYLDLMEQMAVGIAHEVKNPMTTIRQFLQLFGSKEKYKADKKAFEMTVGELDRVNNILDTFSLMARPKSADMKLQSLNDRIMNRFSLIMEEAVQSNVFIKLELSDTQPIMANEEEIWHLLYNLLRNGMDAMPTGGILTIRTFQEKQGVQLLIKDRGHGMPAEIMEKIGTPFLTTNDKKPGLGLAVCYSIAARHNANMKIETGPEGTAVYVTFPAPAPAAALRTGTSAHA